jgi:glycosyltransferase involved in cell wall biosynthesis
MSRPIVYLVEVPTPYRNAEMDRAADGLQPGEIHTIFVRPKADGCFEYDLPQRCPFRVVDGTEVQRGIPFQQVTGYLKELDPRFVIVGGYSQPIVQEVLRWCQRHQVPFGLRSDSNLYSDRLKGTARYLVRRARLSPWVRRARRILLTGTFNQRFWTRYGMQSLQAAWWPQWIDYERYGQANQWRATSHQALRERFGIQAEVAVLHIGRLISRKRVDLLCEALVRSDERLGLVIAGGGPEEATLRQRYQDALGGRLQFLGNVHQNEVPELYAACDAMAVASGPSEPWGMVLNEACAAGLPILCDQRVGAAGDLLRDGENGIALADNTVPQWVEALNALAADADRRARMGQAGRKLIANWQAQSEPAHCLRDAAQV